MVGTATPDTVPVRQERLPDFFIAGHPKCGTTALYEMLRRHPQIFMPRLKEPRYFSDDLRRNPEIRAYPREVETFDEYSSLFTNARPDQRVGDASPVYLLSRTAAGNIAKVQPAARVIAILREPASFLQSLHLQIVQAGTETQADFRKAIALEGARREGREISRNAPRPQMLLYSNHVHYVEQLRRFHAVFPPEQVLVLVYDDYRSDNETTVRRVLQFLEVDDSSPIRVADANPTVGVRSQRLHGLVHAITAGGGVPARTVRKSIQLVTPDRLRTKALAVMRSRAIYAEAPPTDQSFMFELRRRFRPEVEALSEYLNRDLVSLWGYDSLG